MFHIKFGDNRNNVNNSTILAHSDSTNQRPFPYKHVFAILFSRERLSVDPHGSDLSVILRRL